MPRKSYIAKISNREINPVSISFSSKVYADGTLLVSSNTKMPIMVSEGLELKYMDEVIGNLGRVENSLSREPLLIGCINVKVLNGMSLDQGVFLHLIPSITELSFLTLFKTLWYATFPLLAILLHVVK